MTADLDALIDRLRDRLNVYAVPSNLVFDAAAALAALREERDKWKEEHYFQACLTRDLMPYQERAIKAEAERDAAREALKAALPWIVTTTSACHGDKCREPWCRSCFGDDAAEAAAKGSAAYDRARAAIAAKEKP